MWRLTDEQRALPEHVRRVGREEIQPRAMQLDEQAADRAPAWLEVTPGELGVAPGQPASA